MPHDFTFSQSVCSIADKTYQRAQKIAYHLAHYGIRADAITLFGLISALFGLNFLAMQSYFSAFLMLILNRICDIFDGLIARQTKITAFGIFFDIFADNTAAALFIWGFIMGNPESNAAAGGFYLMTLVASSVALCGYAAVSKQNISVLNQSPIKLCLWGTLQNLDIYTALTIMCIFPKRFMPISIFFGLLLIGKTLLIVSSAYYHLEIEKRTKS